MTINEQIVSGRKFRKLIDEASRLWLRISFWTKASDVEFDDGEDAETKFSNVKLIIDNLKQAFQNFKESVQDSLNNIHDNLGGCKIEQEGNNFYIVGADSVRKKLGNVEEGVHIYSSSYIFYYPNVKSGSINIPINIDTTNYKIIAAGVTSANMGVTYDGDTLSDGIYPVTSSVRCSFDQTAINLSFTHIDSIPTEYNGSQSCSINYFYVYIEK